MNINNKLIMLKTICFSFRKCIILSDKKIYLERNICFTIRTSG